MNPTRIPYCDFTWNAVTGCTKGCQTCWARRMAQRQCGRNGYPADDPFEPTFHPYRLDEPLRRKKPSVIAVSFMGDLFDPDVLFTWQARVFDAMREAQQHTFLVLTKQPQAMRKWLAMAKHTLPNVWLGTSVSTQADLWRVKELTKCPAAKRWVSYEPALGPVDFFPLITQIDWLVMGGESGPGAHPMDPEWPRQTRAQCQAAGVPFYLKQMMVDGKLVQMPKLDGRTWEETP